MLRATYALVVGVLLTTSTTSNTGWLPSGHARIDVMFDQRVKTDCNADCVRYAMLLRYQSSTPATSAEIAEWNSFARAGCVDLLAPGRNSFACRVPGATADSTRDGQRTAMSRFHVTREQLQDLSLPHAELHIERITVQLPAETRAALQAFLR